MEFPELGQPCVVCNRNDYLPFKCTHCSKTVCVDHKTDHGLDCPLHSSHFDAVKEPIGESLKRHCDHCRKITLKLELVECHHCKRLHCLYHRHQVQHNCPQLVESKEAREKDAKERSERQQLALDKLRVNCHKEQPDTHRQQSNKTINLIQDPKKLELAKRLRVMKIKQTARGPPNILQEDKIFFLIKFKHQPTSSLSDRAKDGKELRIYTTAKHTIGRMIDWTSDQLGVQNKNHVEGSSQLVFKKFDPQNQDESFTLNSQVPFSQYLESNILEYGDEIILTYLS